MNESNLTDFAKQHGIEGLTQKSLEHIQNQSEGYSIEKAKQFLTFQERIDNELLKHKVITDNQYTEWFSDGSLTESQLQHFLVQFSVFSNLFLIAQLNKMINADSIEAMRASKEILANEIGVIFNSGTKNPTSDSSSPDFISETGSIEGGTFRFKAAHFEWLIHCAEHIGLGFDHLGKRKQGTESTLFFCDELARLYGSDDYAISQASSYAVENWAAAGFWDELVDGFKKYNENNGTRIPYGFFTWHSKLEAQHAEHTQEELEEYYFERSVNEDDFIAYGNEMMKGIFAFWDGLNRHRLEN